MDEWIKMWCVCIYTYTHTHTHIYVILFNLRKEGNPVICNNFSLVAQLVKKLPAVQETFVWSLGWEDPLEKGMATHSSILAWKILWTEEPEGLQSMGSQELDMTEQLNHQMNCDDVMLKWSKLDKNTGVSSHSLLQQIFLIQKSN